ncbi:hypothetical protein NFI96_001673 [Prochilodus magdalenae]|nr:hypothetical protein NFI96_001673 [Prochilodus magdalenae]
MVDGMVPLTRESGSAVPPRRRLSAAMLAKGGCTIIETVPSLTLPTTQYELEIVAKDMAGSETAAKYGEESEAA